MNIATQKECFHWFIKHNVDLAKNYSGRYLVIHNYKVIDWFMSFSEACKYAKSVFQPETYIVQYCSGNESDYTIRVHNVW